jgi:hypothetical protein
LGNQLKDIEIRQSLARRPGNPFDQSNSPFGVNERTNLLPPSRGGQNQMGTLRRFRRVVHILDHKKIELLHNLVESALIDPGMRRVRRNHPKP